MASTSSTIVGAFSDGLRVHDGSGRAVWHKSTPQSVRRAFCSGRDGDGWAAWKKHLAGRKRPTDLAKLLPGDSDPLTWALPEGSDSSPASARDALAALASARDIARSPEVLSPEAWWDLLDDLLSAVEDAAAIDLERDPWLHQLLAGELPLTLAYLLPEIAPCRRLKQVARRALSRGPVDLLDGEGLPHGAHLPLMRPLLACWTRCWALGERLKGGCFSSAAANQYEWFVRQALRMARQDGTHVFCDGAAAAPQRDLFEAALHFGGDDDDRKIAALVLPRRLLVKAGRFRKAPTDRKLPKAATHCEWAATAVLRPDWSRSGERLTVVYAGRSVHTEFGCGKDVLWSGEWELEVRVGGKPALPTSDWEELCWISDSDVDFLELEIELDGDLRVQRQMLLARKDRFLLLADVVLVEGAGAGKLDYRSRLPLGPGVAFQPADESREGFLVGSKPRALVLPLALPEWQAQKCPGKLTSTRRGLQLQQSTEGRRLYAPLFFDFDRRRTACCFTWRPLTVAQSLEVQPADVAAGYRVAVGRRQWLIYRSLAEKANRTLLGHNLSTEMLVARFDHTGKVEPLIEIE